MKINIGIDGGGLEENEIIQSGISREVYEFIKSFKVTNEKSTSLDCYFFINNKKRKVQIQDNHTNCRYFFIPRKFYASFFLPLYSLINKNDIFLGFSGYISPLFSFFGIKTVLFLHDFGFIKFPEKYSEGKKIVDRTIKSINRADLIIFFSEYQKNEFLRLFPKKTDKKIIKIYPGLDHIASVRLNLRKKTKYLITKYFLYVGVIKQMKNIELIIDSYNSFLKKTDDYSVKLVLIGHKEKKYFNKLTSNPLFKKLKKQILFYEKIPDEQLIYFYQNALATINVAFDEGFCFPIFETLYLGGVAIVLNLPLYKEIAQTNSNLKLCYSRNDVTEKMKLTYTVERKLINRRKFNREELFTWNNFTKEILNNIKILKG